MLAPLSIDLFSSKLQAKGLTKDKDEIKAVVDAITAGPPSTLEAIEAKLDEAQVQWFQQGSTIYVPKTPMSQLDVNAGRMKAMWYIRLED